jgi:histidine ammonia-lyase/phenylalanine ammonia-lyase
MTLERVVAMTTESSICATAAISTAARSTNADVVPIDGDSLTLDFVRRVARSEARVSLSSDTRVRSRLEASVALKESLIAEGRPIYGVTTGFGDSAHRQISSPNAEALQSALVRMLGCGTGSYAGVDEARATVLVRANCLARGHSAVRPVILERLLDLLNCDITPAIREQGSVGASGDLVPLSYLAAAIQGERRVFYQGVLRPAAEALAAAGLERVALSSKEGLALVNGTSYMSAIACLAAVDARSLALAADACTALAVEVLTGHDESFNAFVHDVAKPHPGQIRSAASVRHWLHGSQLAQSDGDRRTNLGQLPADGYRQLQRRVQDRYSLRCAPHFVGALWDTLAWVDSWVTTEINSSNDNPLFDQLSGRAVNGGNFAGSHIGLAMDGLRTAVASVADLLDRQLALVVDDKFSEGLPPNLAPQVQPGHPEEGLRHGFKGMQIACSALTAEALHLCTPVTVFSRSTECHNQDKVSMGLIAALRTRDVVRLTEHVVAMHLLVLCQAADLRGPSRLGATRAIYDRVRAISPGLERDRELEDDIAGLVAVLRDGSLFAGLDPDERESGGGVWS